MTSAEWYQPSSEILRRARLGDRDAIDHILQVYRTQLKRVVATRLDSRLAGRIDASDVVQDVLTTACRSISEWVDEGKSVYACLYRLTRDRLARLHRDHISVKKRSVLREKFVFAELSDDSLVDLVMRLGTGSETPSRALLQEESQLRVREALARLGDIDREVLVMRILEGVPTRDTAEILGITESAVNMRQLRALKRMQSLLTHAN